MAVDPSAGPLSAERLNPLIEELRRYARDLADSLRREVYQSGYPVGTDPTPPEEQYQTLVRLRDSGSPLFWHDPQAPADLAKLEQRFGPVRPMRVPDEQPEGPMPRDLFDAPMLQFGGQ